jgi:hypothetical protein
MGMRWVSGQMPHHAAHASIRDVPVVMVPPWLVTCCAYGRCTAAAALMAQVLVSGRMHHGV